MVRVLAKFEKSTIKFGIFLIFANVSGQVDFFSASKERTWYRKPDTVLYRENALTCTISAIFCIMRIEINFSNCRHTQCQST